jgi:hypothetical protein
MKRRCLGTSSLSPSSTTHSKAERREGKGQPSEHQKAKLKNRFLKFPRVVTVAFEGMSVRVEGSCEESCEGNEEKGSLVIADVFKYSK